MRSSVFSLHFILLSALCALLAGCLLKPTTVKTQSYILTPISASSSSSSSNQGSAHLPIGVGLVKMPAYLLQSSMAIRKGSNEVDYLEAALWAERLDQSFQRALAANLAALLPTDQILLSAWRRQDVALAVYVNVEQFDVNADGRGTLLAWWRITTPSGDKVLKSGETNLHRTGPAPHADGQTLAATLSELTADLSKVLVQAIRESSP